MNSNGFSNTKIVGYEHNWDDAGGYPVQVVRSALPTDLHNMCI